MKISAMVTLSEPDRMNFPYLESIQSFLPVVDEMLVIWNVIPRFQDDGLEKIKALNDPKIRIIHGVFDLERLGWPSFGIMRTTGYYASTGDVLLMFDADGILHEDDYKQVSIQCQTMVDDKKGYGFWMKHRFYSTTVCWKQGKHSGIYNKGLLGDNFDFYGGKQSGVPNWGLAPKENKSGKQFSIYLFGYERIWDTEKSLREKTRRYQEMHRKANTIRDLTEDTEEYYQQFLAEKRKKIGIESYKIPIEKHPKIIQDKLRAVTKDQCGYNLFLQ